MKRTKNNKKTQDKQFCIRGHNTFICGRDSQGKCKLCRSEKRKQTYIPHPKLVTQFCFNGHDKNIVGKTSCGACRECGNIRSAIRYETKKEEILLKERNRHNINKEQRNKRRRELRAAPENKEKRRIEGIKYREAHPNYVKNYYQTHKNEILEQVKQYNKEHPEIHRMSGIRSQAVRKLRIVAWTDWPEIKEIYKNRPINKVVDHIIPLQGDEVSGLHVSWNLQYLTSNENNTKYNIVNLNAASEWYGKILEEAGWK